MFESMMIAFREGMEAFLIVAITVAYLNRTGRTDLLPPVYYGIGAAILSSAFLGFWLQSLADNPMTEGILAITAGVMVGSFTIYMLRAARNIGGHIRAGIDTRTSRHGTWAPISIFVFVTLMITREGMETVLMMSAAAYDLSWISILSGIMAGLGLAVLMGYFWVRKSHLIQLGNFLKVTSIFLILFSVQMFLKGLHELSETGALTLNGWIHETVEWMAEGDSIGGQMITYSLVAVPLGWLLIASLRSDMAKPWSKIGSS